MKKIIINKSPWETRIAIVRDSKLENLFFGQSTDTELERSFFKGRVSPATRTHQAGSPKHPPWTTPDSSSKNSASRRHDRIKLRLRGTDRHAGAFLKIAITIMFWNGEISRSVILPFTVTSRPGRWCPNIRERELRHKPHLRCRNPLDIAHRNIGAVLPELRSVRSAARDILFRRHRQTMFHS